MKNWYVARVRQHKEALVAVFLSPYGVEVFSPHFLKGGKREALFLGYVLIYVDLEAPIWPLVRWAKGLMYFLPRGEKPTPLDKSLVAHWKERDGSDRSKPFVSGEPVRIKGGSFDGFEGIFAGMSAKERCRILVKALDRVVPV